MPKNSSSPFPIKVIHSTLVWLQQTMTWMYNHAKYLPKDIESHIVCKKIENLDQFWLPNIHSLPEFSWLSRFGESGLKVAKSLLRIFWLWHMCRKIKPDIVHSHFGNTGCPDSFVVWLTRAKHVVTFYGLDVNMVPKQDPKYLRRYKSLFKSADLFLCEGPHMAECLRKLGCPPDKVKVHHLGVEVDKIAFKPRRWEKGSKLRILIAASFREKKGIPYALEALGQLQNEMDIEVTIIGDASPDERSRREKKRILNVIKKHEMQPIVKMLGYQPYSVLMERAYEHHIFISPSVTAKDGDTEGGAPVSIIEMAASGMPVVSTKHCDIPEVIQDGKTGLLAEERNVKQLMNHLRWLVEHPQEWKEMLIAGRNRIEKEFDVRVQAAGLGEYYKSIVFAQASRFR